MSLLLTICMISSLFACGAEGKQTGSTDRIVEVNPISVPVFNADSAYSYVAKQLDFGPRVPNTESHRQTAEWLAAELARHGAEVIVQQALVTAFDGTLLNGFNIIGQYNPENKERILLFAHWDSRPFADHDPIESNRRKPVPGANDGASGVGVLLEMARLIGASQPSKGIDIIFFDAEDYGTPEFWKGEHRSDSWALGTQYWCKRTHKLGYRARYGILLDMVGAKNATFYREAYSDYFASAIVDKVWSAAEKLGHGAYFINQRGGAINDDHYYVNTMTRIPSIDIIHQELHSNSAFFPYWHTVDDTLDKIDPVTLRVVGETVLYVVYNE